MGALRRRCAFARMPRRGAAGRRRPGPAARRSFHKGHSSFCFIPARGLKFQGCAKNVALTLTETFTLDWSNWVGAFAAMRIIGCGATPPPARSKLLIDTTCKCAASASVSALARASATALIVACVRAALGSARPNETSLIDVAPELLHASATRPALAMSRTFTPNDRETV